MGGKDNVKRVWGWYVGAYAMMYVLAGGLLHKETRSQRKQWGFYVLNGQSLHVVPKHESSILPQKDISSPKWLFLLCRERKNGKWGKEKMKCLWQENNVPEATPLNTERQEDRTSFILHLFFLCVCVFAHLIFSLRFISFSSWNLVLYTEKSCNCRG